MEMKDRYRGMMEQKGHRAVAMVEKLGHRAVRAETVYQALVAEDRCLVITMWGGRGGGGLASHQGERQAPGCVSKGHMQNFGYGNREQVMSRGRCGRG